MNNESEKAMWRCKPVDNPWTFTSLLKKQSVPFYQISHLLKINPKICFH